MNQEWIKIPLKKFPKKKKTTQQTISIPNELKQRIEKYVHANQQSNNLSIFKIF